MAGIDFAQFSGDNMRICHYGEQHDLNIPTLPDETGNLLARVKDVFATNVPLQRLLCQSVGIDLSEVDDSAWKKALSSEAGKAYLQAFQLSSIPVLSRFVELAGTTIEGVKKAQDDLRQRYQ